MYSAAFTQLNVPKAVAAVVEIDKPPAGVKVPSVQAASDTFVQSITVEVLKSTTT